MSQGNFFQHSETHSGVRVTFRTAFMGLCLFGLASAQAAQAADKKPLQPLDVFELEYASDPQFDAKGASLIYVRNFMDIMKDKKRSNLWRMDLDGGNHRPVTTDLANSSQPRFSPDGSRLAYVSNKSGKTQIYVRWLKTGENLQVAQLQTGASNLTWSPDSTGLAFTKFVPSSSKPFAKMPKKPKGADWAAPAKVINKTTYRFDGSGYLPDGFVHVFVVPAEGGTPRQITSGDFNHGSKLTWDKSGNQIFFSANRHEEHEQEPLNSEIYSVNLTGGDIKAITDRIGPDAAPVVSPDGQWIAYRGFDDKRMGYHNSRLYVMRKDGSDSRLLTGDLDRSISGLVWASNSREIYFQYDDLGNTRVAKVNFKGRLKNLVTNVGGTAFGRPYSGGDFTVSPKGRIAFTQTSVKDMANIAVTNIRGTNALALTALNDDLLPGRALGAVEEVWYESSFDGQKIQGWLAKPADFDPAKKYPLILEIHGGPFANYGFRFSPEVQLYTAAGYMVLYTNPRGSTSYGDKFANLIHHDYPGHDYEDLMSGVDFVIEKGNVDAERLYVTGGSGGGVLTSWIIGKTDRFKAAVVAKPVINWASFTLYSDISMFVAKYWFGEMPWENPVAYWQRSPLSLVGNVKTPTMMLTGESDFRTPIPESEQYYQALRLQKVEAVMVRIPNASHGITRRPSNLIAKISHIVKWFDDHGGTDKEEK